jgi:ParB family chromosome partitioning protein
MARRRRIEAPTPEELARIEGADRGDGFAAKPSAMAPIARVAGEAAALGSALDPEAEAARARDRREAAELRRLRAEGWEVREIPIDAVRTDAMPRDRMSLDPEAMEELRASIRQSGLRMPIEVSLRNPEAGAPEGAETYDLLSGFRRLSAMRDVAGAGGTVRALVRPARAAAARLAAMIEENEIRAGLSSYERGRAAALAVEAGVFANIEAAVDALFAAASKAKRSKVRSFARLHEELGDLLAFPQSLSERQCLRLAAALKSGAGRELRAALGTGLGTDPEGEWALLEEVLRPLERPPAAGPRARRARAPALPEGYDPAWIPLARDRFIHRDHDRKGHMIRFVGPHIDGELIEEVMREIERWLGET